MLKINTYIKKDGIIKQNDELNNFFVLVSNAEVFQTVKDSCYMEGAIEIIWNEELIMGLEQWDLIDQLWTYFVDGICEVLNGKHESIFWFPDQPILVKFLDFSNGYIMLMVGEKKIVEEKNYLLETLLKAANFFFLKYFNVDETKGGKMLDTIGNCIKKLK